ncbi:hypothetical protein, partial [Klebsiella variicola]|uniref:hypothetical protein n=1 Tax=Klebsiella variicola TaxID=244366 RepID=UPI001A918BF9
RNWYNIFDFCQLPYKKLFAGLCSLAIGHKISEMTEENPPRSGKRRRSMAQATPPCGPVA